MTMPNTLRERLKAGEPVIGSWINTASPIVAELMAGCGFGFLTIDAEHSAVDLPQVQQLLQAVRSGNPDCAGLVRVPGADYAQIKRFMDSGAAGVICPLVNTADEAREVVEAVKYPVERDEGRDLKPERRKKDDRETHVSSFIPQPSGRRGVGFCRDNMYGLSVVETVARSNGATVVCVQIEHVDGIANIDEILGVEGVDAVFIGPYDLTASMGITARFEHPDYLAAKRKVLDACRAHGAVPGIHVVQPDLGEARRAVEEGYRMIGYSLDITILSSVCTSALRELAGGGAGGPLAEGAENAED